MRNDTAWQRVTDLAAQQYGAFNRRQATERELSGRRIKRAVEAGQLQQPLPNVFVVAGSNRSWRQQLMVATLAGPVASHRSAARLHRLDGKWPTLIEVTTDRRRKICAPEGAIVHRWRRLDASQTLLIDGIRTTSLAHTLVQLGAVVGPDAVEQALDDALRRGTSPVWIEQTLERLWRPGPTGAGVLLGILRDPRRVGRLPDSWFERLTQRLMASPDLPAAELQYEVLTRHGSRRLDLAYPNVKLGIEAHSRHFHFGPGQEEADGQRDLELAGVGWEVLYLTWGMAHEPDHFVPLVVDAHRARRRLYGTADTRA